MLQATHVTLHRGTLSIFSDLSFSVAPGHKAGLVGRNGAGKSTLFQLLTGELQSDGGELSVPRGWKIVHMAQQVLPSARAALDYVIDGHAELRAVEAELSARSHADPAEIGTLHARFEDLGGHEAQARAGEILHGLGFTPAEFTRPYREFSGGMRIRLNLGQALMSPGDLLLLDEPTNHLDLETTLWLEAWLKRFDGTLLLIAHDRSLLDAVCDQIIHLEAGKAASYRGNYSSFERQRAAQLAQQQAAFARQQQEIKHIRAFVDRFRAKASKARQAQSRLKALERMQQVAPVHAASPYRFTFSQPARMSNPLLRLEHVSVGYDGQPTLERINASILPGDRIGILGVNGAGKSTLLKCLVGELDPLSGELTRGTHAQTGYFAQHQLETLDGARSALTILTERKPESRAQWCRDYLGAWGFNAELTDRPTSTLSGGEKARLVLALIALEQPALLVLDEPTNHLDLEMREALGLALQDYAGALVLVSHDRNLLQRTVDEFWVVADGTVTPYAENLDTYVKPPASDPKAPSAKRAARQAAAAQRRLEQPYRERVRRLESEIDSLTQRLREAEATLADTDVYRQLAPTRLDRLLADAGRLRKALEAAEQQWVDASEALEDLSSKPLC